MDWSVGRLSMQTNESNIKTSTFIDEEKREVYSSQNNVGSDRIVMYPAKHFNGENSNKTEINTK